MRFALWMAVPAATILGASGLTGVSATEDSPPRLELPMTSSWNFAAEDTFCRLLGQFGDGDKQLFLDLTALGPGAGWDMRVYGKPLATSTTYGVATVTFGPGGPPVKTMTIAGTSNNLPMLSFGYMTPASASSIAAADGKGTPSGMSDDAAAVRWLDIDIDHWKRYRLDVGSLRSAVKLFDACTDALVHDWGYDPAVLRQLTHSATPKSDPRTWIVPDDYPPAMLLRGEIAEVHFRLDVDPKGDVSGCTIVWQTRGPDFADKTCAALRRRAHFAPALDAKGTPVASPYNSVVRWYMGSPPPGQRKHGH